MPNTLFALNVLPSTSVSPRECSNVPQVHLGTKHRHTSWGMRSPIPSLLQNNEIPDGTQLAAWLCPTVCSDMIVPKRAFPPRILGILGIRNLREMKLKTLQRFCSVLMCMPRKSASRQQHEFGWSVRVQATRLATKSRAINALSSQTWRALLVTMTLPVSVAATPCSSASCHLQ